MKTLPRFHALTLLALANAMFDAPLSWPEIISRITVSSSTISDGVNTYGYILTDGQIAPWMQTGNVATGAAAVAKQCTLTVNFIGTENSDGVPTAALASHTKTARVTLCTIEGGTYGKFSGMPGEVIPFGLAGYIYNYAQIPQYEGSYTISEIEVTDQCPMGNNLNLSGGLAEWANMNACIQQIHYDLVNGRTTITYGPAKHLGPAELSKRLQVNNGPRWYNLNGNNITNASGGNGTQLGANVAQRGPSPGPRAVTWQHHPIDLADENANTYDYGTPGIHLDNRSDPPPNYGAVPGTPIYLAGLTIPNKQPTLALIDGIDGALGTVIRLSTADLPDDAQAFFQKLAIYQCVEGALVAKTAYVLMTTPA